MRVRSRLSDERGATAVMMVFLLVVIIGMLALAIDGGLLFVKYRQARRANDAAALAAALECATSGNQSKADASANTVAAGNASDVKGVLGSPNVYTPGCNTTKGTVKVRYGSTQATGGGVEIMLWPALCALLPSCSVTSPKDVVASATAIWGAAAGGPVFPLTLGKNKLSNCGIPDSMTDDDIGTTRCAFYFDQGAISTWGLIDLDTWGVSPTDSNACGGKTPSGNDKYVDWYNDPPTKPLNDDPMSNPVFVCPTPGDRDVLYANESFSPNAVVAKAVQSGQMYSFPVNNPGPCPSAPLTCNILNPDGSLELYAIIGFAWLKPVELCPGGGNNTTGFSCTGSNATTNDKQLCDALLVPPLKADPTSRCLVAQWEGYTTVNVDPITGDSFGNVRSVQLTG